MIQHMVSECATEAGCELWLRCVIDHKRHSPLLGELQLRLTVLTILVRLVNETDDARRILNTLRHRIEDVAFHSAVDIHPGIDNNRTESAETQRIPTTVCTSPYQHGT